MMILKEDLFDDILVSEVPNPVIDDISISTSLDVPEIGPEMGISTLLMQAIKDTYTMIDSLNSLYIALSDVGASDKMDVMSQIIADETSHIGSLQAMLKDYSPNMENIDSGEELVIDEF